MKHKMFFLLAIFLFLFALTVNALPGVINYQGVLTSSSGIVVNGQVSVQFALYEQLSGGTPLWQETQTVNVQQGLFNVNLGAVTPITLVFDASYYLGVKVGSDAEMSPRQPLTSTPYAFSSANAESATTLNKQCADGEVLRYNGQTHSWQCSFADTTGSSLVNKGFSGVLTVEGLTAAGPEEPLDPNENILVYDYMALEITQPASIADGDRIISAPVVSDMTVLCQSGGKTAGLMQKLFTGQAIDRVALWVPNPVGGFSKLIELQTVYLTSHNNVAPQGLDGLNLQQFSFSFRNATLYAVGDGTASLQFDVALRTSSGPACSPYNFALDYGFEMPGDYQYINRLDYGAEKLVSDFTGGGTSSSRVSVSDVQIASDRFGTISVCLATLAFNGGHIDSVQITTPTSWAPFPPLSEIELQESVVSHVRVYSGAEGTPVWEAAFNFAEIAYTDYIYGDDGRPIGQSDFSWNVVTNSAP